VPDIFNDDSVNTSGIHNQIFPNDDAPKIMSYGETDVGILPNATDCRLEAGKLLVGRDRVPLGQVAENFVKVVECLVL
jgi:hypothetical protein